MTVPDIRPNSVCAAAGIAPRPARRTATRTREIMANLYLFRYSTLIWKCKQFIHSVEKLVLSCCERFPKRMPESAGGPGSGARHEDMVEAGVWVPIPRPIAEVSDFGRLGQGGVGGVGDFSFCCRCGNSGLEGGIEDTAAQFCCV
jgi:hypothetical protein